mgnify:CR=1 FL=1
MVITQGVTNAKPSATSYGRLHDIARKHDIAKKKYESRASRGKVTRLDWQQVTNPLEIKKLRAKEYEAMGKSGISSLSPKIKLAMCPAVHAVLISEFTLWFCTKDITFSFCKNCCNYDNEPEKHKIKIFGSHTYRCNAGHTSQIFSTTKMKTYCPSHDPKAPLSKSNRGGAPTEASSNEWSKSYSECSGAYRSS